MVCLIIYTIFEVDIYRVLGEGNLKKYYPNHGINYIEMNQLMIKISIFILLAAAAIVFVTEVKAQNVEVQNVDVIVNDTDYGTAGAPTEELAGGNWVLSSTESKIINSVGITKWEPTTGELTGITSWKDVLTIVHTVASGFKWQDPPKSMQPGTYLNLEAVYTNIDYSTTAKLNTGIKMFIERAGGNYLVMESNAIEVLKMNKDNKQYANEVKKGFFYAPKFFFDATNQCQLIVDCYIGKDHYITTYTYSYQP